MIDDLLPGRRGCDDHRECREHLTEQAESIQETFHVATFYDIGPDIRQDLSHTDHYHLGNRDRLDTVHRWAHPENNEQTVGLASTRASSGCVIPDYNTTGTGFRVG